MVFSRNQGNATGQWPTTLGNTAIARAAIYTGLARLLIAEDSSLTPLEALRTARDATAYIGYGDDALLGIKRGRFPSHKDPGFFESFAKAVFAETGMVVTPGNKGADRYVPKDDSSSRLAPLTHVSFLKRSPVRLAFSEIEARCGQSVASLYPDGVYASALDPASIIATASYVLKRDPTRVATSSRAVSALAEAVAHGLDFYERIYEIVQGPFTYAGAQLPLVDGAGRPILWPSFEQFRTSYVRRACVEAEFTLDVEEPNYDHLYKLVKLDQSMFL